MLIHQKWKVYAVELAHCAPPLAPPPPPTQPPQTTSMHCIPFHRTNTAAQIRKITKGLLRDNRHFWGTYMNKYLRQIWDKEARCLPTGFYARINPVSEDLFSLMNFRIMKTIFSVVCEVWIWVRFASKILLHAKQYWNSHYNQKKCNITFAIWETVHQNWQEGNRRAARNKNQAGAGTLYYVSGEPVFKTSFL